MKKYMVYYELDAIVDLFGADDYDPVFPDPIEAANKAEAIEIAKTFIRKEVDPEQFYYKVEEV